MTKQEILERIQNVLYQGADTESQDLDLLRNDLEDDIIWERETRKYKKDSKFKFNKNKSKEIKKPKFPDYQCTGDNVI